MSIKQNGGVFGRNPTFNDVTIEGDLIINGEVFTGLDFQGSWNASTNTPSLASSTGTNGEFYIVSVAGTTDLNGITNWGIGDWAIFNGTVWQRVEGGADGNFNDLTAKNLTVSSTGVPEIKIQDLDGTNKKTQIKHSNGTTQLVSQDGDSYGTTLFQTYNGSSTITRQRIASNGDISFYEDTGTTAKLFWDASAESLGIGTSSPHGLTHWESTTGTVNLIATNDAANGQVDTTVMSLIGQARSYNNDLPKLASIDFRTDPTTWYKGNITFNVANSDGTNPAITPLEAMRIDSSGNVSIPNGDLTIASGNGVYLGGTGAANKLDDYEEGTWTPTVKDNSGNSATASTATGYYTKIGREVHIACELDNIDTTGLVSGDQVRIIGIPFPAATLTNNVQWFNVIGKNNVLTTSDSVVVSIADGFGYVRLKKAGEVVGVWLAVSALTSGTADIKFNLTYFTS